MGLLKLREVQWLEGAVLGFESDGADLKAWACGCSTMLIIWITHLLRLMPGTSGCGLATGGTGNLGSRIIWGAEMGSIQTCCI
jgi:hypothetical protein